MMLKRSKSLQIFVAAGMLALIVGYIPFAQAEEEVQGQVTILGLNCGVAIDGGSPIQYGSLTIGQVSEQQTLNYHNDGNTFGNVYVRGTNWEDTNSQIIVMPVGSTRMTGLPFGNDDYNSKIVLTETNQNIATVVGGASMTSRWQLAAVDMFDTAYAGDAIQTVTVGITC